jgi:uncharacterized protein (DUF1684 family)
MHHFKSNLERHSTYLTLHKHKSLPLPLHQPSHLHLHSFLLLLLLLLLSSGCSRSLPTVDEVKWSEELETWRAGRMDRLIGDRGWATITGLDWLEPGANTVGSARGSKVQFDSASAVASVGVIYFEEGFIRFTASQGAEVYYNGEQISEVEMLGELTESQVILSTGTVQFAVLRRGEKYGIRTWDSQAPILNDFGDIPIFTPDPSWYIQATFHRYEPTKYIDLVTVLDISEKNPVDGYFEFQYAGETFRLDALGVRADTSLFVIVGDVTNRSDTYGAGRYLYVDRKDTAASVAEVWIDFNRVYNPPCAFTPYSTCALPPEQNKLPFPLTAGEKRYLR